jgi:predicted secreted Zn-dependent protease
LDRLAIALSGFGINVISELRSCSINNVGLIIVRDKIIVLIVTWRTTWENSPTSRVEWDALVQVIRKAMERHNRKGQRGVRRCKV